MISLMGLNTVFRVARAYLDSIWRGSGWQVVKGGLL